MFNNDEFSKILNKIVSRYQNISDFANISKVGRSYISKYINKKIDAPPSPKVLKKIALHAKGETTYSELMQICGYADYMIDDFFDDAIQQENNKIPIVYDITYQNNSFITTTNGQYVNANFIIDEKKEYFAYINKSDDMLPLLGIGDLAIIEKSNTYVNGQTCLISLDNKLIIIRKIIDFKDYIELHTAFPFNQPIKLTHEEIKERNFKILGKVIRVENESAFK